MKKELFNLLVERILAQPDLFSTHKVTIKEGLEVHSFGSKKNSDLAEAKALFKEKGYKMDDVHTDAIHLADTNRLQNTYLTILYGAEKDKISISTFEMGYALAYNKQRYYPKRKNNPVFSYTQRMYGFKYMKKGKPLVRIHLGEIHIPGFFNTKLDEILTKTLLNVDYIPKARISYRHLMNTKSDMQGLSNMFGVRVPEALKVFPIEQVLHLYKTIKDFNQINKLCQFIAKTEDHSDDLYDVLSEMLFQTEADAWLVRDAIRDGLTLKKRNISLAVTSRKRWIDEHQKATKLRMLAGVPEIKVHEEYKKALEGIEYPCELIETKDRLVQESVELHHCVATYARKINTGGCAIFSIDFEGKRYTLEVRMSKFNNEAHFTLVQFRGLCNELAPDVIGKHVEEILKKNSCQVLEVAYKEPEPLDLIF